MAQTGSDSLFALLCSLPSFVFCALQELRFLCSSISVGTYVPLYDPVNPRM